MSYTIATRARRHGIFFEPHELEPIGIRENSRCWGLWVEGRDFDSNSRLDGPERWFRNESPHLVVSPIHPTYWPIAFNLRVLLQRRPIGPEEQNPERCDAIFGFADALSRCGVNILYFHTSQTGYDLVDVDATCELPRLRLAAQRIMDPIDHEGGKLDARRRELHRRGVAADSIEAELRPHSESLFVARARAFQHLGLLLIPELAELEARLVVIERQRYRYARLQRATARDASAADRTQLKGLEADAHSPAMFPLVTGESFAGSPQERERRYIDALNAAWFFNRKVIGAGENAYFLSYHSVQDRESIGRLLQEWHSGSKPGKQDVAELAELFRFLHITLSGRYLAPGLKEIIPKTPARAGTKEHQAARSGTAERLADFKLETELKHAWYRDFFRRQSHEAIRITALSALAYARFWALGGSEGEAAPIPFKYRGNMLTPILTEDAPEGGSSRLTRLLNTVTFCGSDPARGTFGAQMAVFANVNLHDRVVRLRFAREGVEPRSYLTVRAAYRVETGQRSGPDSQGLLAKLTALLLSEQFRVERAFNTIKESDDAVERGTLEVIVRATNESAVRTCELLRRSPEAVLARWRADLLRRLRRPLDTPARLLRLKVTNGFVPRDR